MLSSLGVSDVPGRAVSALLLALGGGVAIGVAGEHSSALHAILLGLVIDPVLFDRYRPGGYAALRARFDRPIPPLRPPHGVEATGETGEPSRRSQTRARLRDRRFRREKAVADSRRTGLWLLCSVLAYLATLAAVGAWDEGADTLVYLVGIILVAQLVSGGADREKLPPPPPDPDEPRLIAPEAVAPVGRAAVWVAATVASGLCAGLLEAPDWIVLPPVLAAVVDLAWGAIGRRRMPRTTEPPRLLDGEEPSPRTSARLGLGLVGCTVMFAVVRTARGLGGTQLWLGVGFSTLFGLAHFLYSRLDRRRLRAAEDRAGADSD